jgi:riboflavin synthase
MFTGLVTDVGEVIAAEDRGDLRRIRIACNYPVDTIAIGASIACAGPCLTAVAVGQAGDRTTFDVDAAAETLARTTAGEWKTGTRLNLERSLKLGDELGGHIVTGHVDAAAMILERTPDGDSVRFVFESPPGLARFIAPKGSIALDGISLTVNEVEGTSFGVNIIPYTLAHTTWQDRQPGDLVNLEVDLLARYVARLRE